MHSHGRPRADLDRLEGEVRETGQQKPGLPLRCHPQRVGRGNVGGVGAVTVNTQCHPDPTPGAMSLGACSGPQFPQKAERRSSKVLVLSHSRAATWREVLGSQRPP